MNSYSFNYTSDGAFFGSAVFNTVNVKRQKNVPIIFKTNQTFPSFYDKTKSVDDISHLNRKERDSHCRTGTEMPRSSIK